MGYLVLVNMTNRLDRYINLAQIISYLGEDNRASFAAKSGLADKPDIRFELVDVQRLARTDVDVSGVGRR